MIEIRNISTIEEFRKLPEIQRSAWQFRDIDIEPHHLMTRVRKYGGIVQGLFNDGEMIGITYAIIGQWEGAYFLYSHMAAVKKEYQGQGFGFMLKKAQGEEAIKMGYDVMRWNFDPLESLNGYFNLHKLGVISVEYDRNIYGVGESGLHKGMVTDRLIATWYLTSDRVARKMKTKEPKIIQDVSEKELNNLSLQMTYIEIPSDIRKLKLENMDEAIAWRMKTRDQFESAIQKGFTVVDIVFSKSGDRVFYKLCQEHE